MMIKYLAMLILFLVCFVRTVTVASECSGLERGYYRNCNEVLESGQSCSGVYSVKPDHLPPFEVYCDMETDGGGWIVIQRRMDGSVDFNRKWKDYVVGFGDLNSEFWLGLSKIHRLTESTAEEETNLTLRVDFQDFGGHIVENATYNQFQVHGPSIGYQISFTEISAGNSKGLSSENNNMKFSTDDVDNDLFIGLSCAQKYKAGWWYNKCHGSQLNEPYPGGRIEKEDKLKVEFLSFEFSEMKLRQEQALVVFTDCKEAFEHGHIHNGIFTIRPDNQSPFHVYCDMETNGGGWAVFQRRQDGSEDFFRNWKDYKTGFGDLNGEFWLGLDKMNRLTTTSGSGQRNTLRIDLGDFEGNKRYAKYTTFRVLDSSTNYRLNVGGYSGDATDSLQIHNNMMFSTKDRDNDIYGAGQCANRYKGGWWYQSCHNSNLNGLYSSTAYGEGINWRHWKGYHYSLKFTEMKVYQERD